MQKKTLLIIGGIVIVILIIIIFVLPKIKPEPRLIENVPTPSTTISETNDISIKDSSFIPNILTIKKGTSVSWTNNEKEVHTIDSTNFSSANLKKGDSFSYTFNESGTFDYSCGVHPTMIGKIIVVD